MPSPIQNFAGVSNINSVLPPDTNGDVGPNHYVQWVNLSFAIYDKNGNKLYGPAAGNTLWTGFGGVCETTNNGDPVVIYDHLADRWLMSQFAFNFDFFGDPTPPFYQCIAISQTPDPTGSWYRYSFLVSNTKLNDYPKFGLWSDAYYMSVNQFDDFRMQNWAGQGVFAFDRSKMLAGQSATFVYFDLFQAHPALGNMLPSHLNGPNSPSSGTPNYFVQFDTSPNQLEVWGFHVDWTAPANSTFTNAVNLTVSAFNPLQCIYLGTPTTNCVPQPGTTAKLDALSDRLMYRLQYRKFANQETLVVNHTVDADGTTHSGIRWYELRKTSGNWYINQQGTYAPDSEHRWMGSIAMDGMGNIALGYSVSSSATYPSIRYSGRLTSDTAGTLPQAETTLIAGGGSQTSSSYRWGDYSTMSIDPTDDCTFWYTQEYYSTTSAKGWLTRIGSFKFPSCVSNSACTYTISPTSQTFSSSGGTGSVTVTASSSLCAWTVTNTLGWVTITSGSSGTGNGTVNYSVSENSSGASRTGNMTIAGQTFVITQAGVVTLTASINPTGGGFVSSNGINCPGVCSANYNLGTVITLTATANIGYQFSSWNGCDSTSGNTCNVTMSANKSVTANFTTCANLPARIGGVYYSSLQAAYNAAADGDTIQSQTVLFVESPNFNRNISLIIQGGFDCNYSTNSGMSAVNGTLTITNGSVLIGNVTLQ